VFTKVGELKDDTEILGIFPSALSVFEPHVYILLLLDIAAALLEPAAT
jgi:hypothetical protein